MNDTTHASIFGTTRNPCPSWCTELPGHGYDTSDSTCETRIHTHDFGDVWSNERLVISVALLAAENVTSGLDGVDVTVGAAEISLESTSAALTSDEARKVSAMLLAAADLLDKVNKS